MAEARSVMIRASGGRVRVMRPTISEGGIWLFQYEAYIGSGTCRRCGCTDLFGCPGGCGWVNATHTLCSRCAGRMVVR